MIPDMPKHLDALKKRDDFRDLANITPVIRKSIFDSKKVEDHHGIIPTDECVDIRRLGSEAENLFDIIARRFIAALMPDAKGSTTSISRSEERRVGKECVSKCKSRGSPSHKKHTESRNTT